MNRFLLQLAIVIGGALFFVLVGPTSASAVSSNSPENGYYFLRYHYSGHVTNIPLSIYSQSDQRPAGAVFRLNNRSDGCNPSTDSSIRVRVRISRPNNLTGRDDLYNELLTHSSCRNDTNTGTNDTSGLFRTYSIADNRWVRDDTTGLWHVDIDIPLSKTSSNSGSWYRDPARQAHVRFDIRTTGLLVTNRDNEYGSPGYQQNYGVMGGQASNPAVWGPAGNNYYNPSSETLRRKLPQSMSTAREKNVEYVMDFAMPCSLTASSVVKRIGIWDPDNFIIRYRIQSSPREGDTWTNISHVSSSNRYRASPIGSSGQYIPGPGDQQRSWVQITLHKDRKYRLMVQTQNDDLTSLFWPYNTINSEVDCRERKSPKVQILGNDARVRGRVITSVVVEDAKLFGSWVEFAALSTLDNRGFGSGAPSSSTLGQAEWNKLTFANTTSSGDGTQFGRYGNLPSVPAIADHFSGITGNCASPLANGRHVCGNVTLNGRVNVDGTVVIKSSGTVTIAGNITYRNGPYGSIDQLPQVIIIARNIIINDNVTRIDAWLISQGDGNSIKTCGNRNPASPGLSTRVCNQQLIVNGPVITNELYLHRTFGSEGTTDDEKTTPSEIINLRSDAYLWAYNQERKPVYTTTSIVELPPRF